MILGLEAILPVAARQRFETARLAARIRRYGASSLDRLPDLVAASADRSRIARLTLEMRASFEKDPVSAAKYTKPRYWLLLNAERAARLRLDRTRGLRILDIGCGPGYFMAAARLLGHDTEGVEAPETYLTPVERRVYAEMIEALGCGPFVRRLLIERLVPLPFADESYDLITAFWICFNRHQKPDEWGVEEWRFFVKDAFRCLRPGGRLFLDLNEHRERYGDLRWFDAPTLAYFRSIGSVDGGRVLLPCPGARAMSSR